jgi:hypothetical protein
MHCCRTVVVLGVRLVSVTVSSVAAPACSSLLIDYAL